MGEPPRPRTISFREFHLVSGFFFSTQFPPMASTLPNLTMSAATYGRGAAPATNNQFQVIPFGFRVFFSTQFPPMASTLPNLTMSAATYGRGAAPATNNQFQV